MKFWLREKPSSPRSLIMAARRVFRPAKAQQRPERFWSVIAASGMRSETEESIEVRTARSRLTVSTSVVATALPARRAAASARKEAAASATHWLLRGVLRFWVMGDIVPRWWSGR